jgi:hypothetical protein
VEALTALAAAVADTDFAGWASGSALAYPVANVLHLLGLVLLVGGIGLVDLRVLGAFPRLPLEPLAHALTPLAVGGVLVLAASGSVMFAADAEAFAASGAFRWKLALIAVAVVNAAAFRLLLGPAGRRWQTAPARIMAAASLAAWLTVATLGRMIAYS